MSVFEDHRLGLHWCQICYPLEIKLLLLLLLVQTSYLDTHSFSLLMISIYIYHNEPPQEKTCLQALPPVKTQIGLPS